MHLPYLSHQCSKSSPSFQIILDFFLPMKRPIHIPFTGYIRQSPRESLPRARCRKNVLHCHLVICQWDPCSSHSSAACSKYFPSCSPSASSSDILHSTAIFEYPLKHSCSGILFFSHSVFTNSSSAFASSLGSRDSRVPQGSQIDLFSQLFQYQKRHTESALRKDQRQLYLLFKKHLPLPDMVLYFS